MYFVNGGRDGEVELYVKAERKRVRRRYCYEISIKVAASQFNLRRVDGHVHFGVMLDCEYPGKHARELIMEIDLQIHGPHSDWIPFEKKLNLQEYKDTFKNGYTAH